MPGQLRRSPVPLTWLAATLAALLVAPLGGAHPEHDQPASVDLPPGEARSGHVACPDGIAGIFPCRNVDLLAVVSLQDFGTGLGFGNDLWGWTDPETRREYVIQGLSDAVAFVEVTTPEVPVVLGILPAQTVGSFWGDFKTYDGHAFIVTEAEGQGLEIFDLRQLAEVDDPPATFDRSAHYSGFDTAHNIAINEETGFAYVVGSDTCGGGLHILDLSAPRDPRFVACYGAHGYVHDTQCVIYRGPDAEHAGREICINSNTDHLAIVDVTDKAAMAELSVSVYAGASYTHQGWLTEDHRYFLLGDEEDELDLGHNARTYVWDVTDLDAPRLVGDYTGDLPATDHNLYVRGEHVYEANYASGLRVLRIGDLAKAEMVEVGYFDTFPIHDAVGFGVGAWSVYPFFPSGTVAVSDIAYGLFLLGVDLAAVPECRDGIDNDGDGLVDSGADPGCLIAAAPAEDPHCDDGIDNDGDGLFDFDDPACQPDWPFWEEPPCGPGFELAALAPLFCGLWRRRAYGSAR